MRLLAVSPVQAFLDSALFIAFLVLVGLGMAYYYSRTAGKVRRLKHNINFLRGALSKIESDLVLADQDDINVQNALSRIYMIRTDEETL